MAGRLKGDPNEYIRKIMDASSNEKEVVKEGNRTQEFWDTDCRPDAFRPSYSTGKLLLFKSGQ